ncbi:MAG: hypothetical protein WA431_11485 [Candidatus Cybelea sp.]
MRTIARFAIGTSAAAAMLAGCGGHAGGSAMPLVYPSSDASVRHHTFQFTGTMQSFNVPAGVTFITVVARGAGGAPAPYPRYPKTTGRGGRVYAVIPVTPGQWLHVFVGGEGSAEGAGVGSGGTGFNGGAAGGLYPYCGRSGYKCYGFGGGGASDVRENGLRTSRIIVAGGGGGAGTDGVNGGGGGRKIGGDGGSGDSYYGGGGGGGGGTQSQGGSGGRGQYGSYGTGGSGNPGTLGEGGSGGQAGGYPPSGCGSTCYAGAGGGGGGGYYGGGGGGGACAPTLSDPECGLGGGGGGGSSYAESSAKNVHMWRNWKNATGNGLVVFSW